MDRLPHRSMKNKMMFVAIISFVFLLSACASHHRSGQQPSASLNPTSIKGNISHWKLSLDVPEGEFFKICCWESDSQVIYVTNIDKGSNVYRYNFLTGRSTLIYKSEYPIVAVQKSPEGKYTLIQSSPSSYAGAITVLDQVMKPIWVQSLPSFELSFEWNPYKESELLISAFKEDWSFNVFYLNVERKKLLELHEPQPFLKWINPSSIAYVDWKKDEAELLAPVLANSLGNTKVYPIFDKVYQFGAFKDVLFTINIDKQDKSKAVYSFYDQSLKNLYSFKAPLLAQFSDYLVPFSDFNARTHRFLVFQPLISTDKDLYKDGFQLVAYDIKHKKRKVVMEGMENLPLLCSPSGKACLYGNRFEKLFDVQKRKIFVIQQQKSG